LFANGGNNSVSSSLTFHQLRPIGLPNHWPFYCRRAAPVGIIGLLGALGVALRGSGGDTHSLLVATRLSPAPQSSRRSSSSNHENIAASWTLRELGDAQRGQRAADDRAGDGASDRPERTASDTERRSDPGAGSGSGSCSSSGCHVVGRIEAATALRTVDSCHECTSSLNAFVYDLVAALGALALFAELIR
jgi:hypothetical protein